MHRIFDSEINDMKHEEHRLLRAVDKQEISENEFEEKVVPLRQRIADKIKMLMSEFDKNKPEEVVNKMAEKVKQEEKKPGIRSRASSVATAVAEALQKKSVRNVEQAIAEVRRMKPEVTEKVARTKIGIIINETKNGKGRWRNYTWDEANYQLNPKA